LSGTVGGVLLLCATTHADDSNRVAVITDHFLIYFLLYTLAKVRAER
jgi:hypothetical protein